MAQYIKTIRKQGAINREINESVKAAMEEIMNNRRIKAEQTAKEQIALIELPLAA